LGWVIEDKRLKFSNMYITGILQYLIWPAFIFAAWYIIKAGVEYYEKKFPAGEERE
jgi:hypothetical protein